MAKTEKNEATPLTDDLEQKKLDDFIARYANNVFLESTAWDLKMVFGQVNLAEKSISQHTAMTIPWPQLKILVYLLQIHLISHEADNGRIPLFKDAIRPIEAVIPNDIRRSVPQAEKYWQRLRTLYEQFLAENPEVGGSPKK